jgi:flagellar secretion chaperone FliS
MNAQLSYREAAVQGASPVRLVILLYEQAVEDLRRALATLQQHDIEGRTRHINHALLVLGHLQATLDKQQGGSVALDLERFYAQLRVGLMEAQGRQSAALLEDQISHLMQVLGAWCEVERRHAVAASTGGATEAQPERNPGSSEWNA